MIQNGLNWSFFGLFLTNAVQVENVAAGPEGRGAVVARSVAGGAGQFERVVANDAVEVFGDFFPPADANCVHCEHFQRLEAPHLQNKTL